MLTLRPGTERGYTQLDWLKSHHSFSFDQYYDPAHMSFGPLRVINEDTIAAGGGFGTHPHRDMEIITYIVSGKLQHRDSLGTGSIISAGEIQKMSAGSGIMHSEFNASNDEPVHLLQIWIVPNERNLKPGYEQEKYDPTPGKWQLLGSPDGKGLVSIRQNVRLYRLALLAEESSRFEPATGSKLWIQAVKGTFSTGETTVKAGDGIAISDDKPLDVTAIDDSELLLFEVLSG